MKKPRKAPHRCPVCDGKGHVPPGFYDVVPGIPMSNDLGLDRCKSCAGAGIVWEPEEPPKKGLALVPEGT